MKTISVQNTTMKLTEVVDLAGKDLVILRHNGKNSFALIRLDEGDLEALSLSQNPDFMAMLDKARLSYEKKGGVSLEEVKRRFGKRVKRRSSRNKH